MESTISQDIQSENTLVAAGTRVEPQSLVGMNNDAASGEKRPRESGSDRTEQDSRPAKSSKPSSDDEGWDEDIHRQFVASIFEIGLRNSSPAVIVENMTQKPKSITSERVKSKLQKYRNNKEKSRQEFLEQYEAFLQRAKAIDCTGAGGEGSPMALLEMMGSSKLLGGDAAAFLSYAVMKEQEANRAGGDGSVLPTQLLRKGAMEYVENFAGSGIPFPELTEEEKKSSLGVSMTYVMGLFLSMTQHLTKERAEAEKLTGGFTPDDNAAQQDGSTKVSFSLDNAARFALKESNGGYPGDFNDNVKSGEATGETNDKPDISYV